MGISQIDTLNQKRLEKRNEVKIFLDKLKSIIKLNIIDLNIEENQQSLEGLVEKLSKDTINISIVAEVSNGKSTFLNALVFNEPVLESKIGETTAKVFNIKYGESFSINGKNCQNIQELKEQISIENSTNLQSVTEQKELSNIQSIITLPNENLKKGIELYDTPGFTTINEKSMLTLIKNAVSKSDATILLLDISQGIKNSEALFIKNILHQIPVNKRFIILNKYDTIFDEDDFILKSKEEIKGEVDNLVEQMKKILYNLQKEDSQTIETFTLSSKKALVGKITKNKEKLNESRFPIFEELFWKRVVEAKDELFEDRVQLFDQIKDETQGHLIAVRENFLNKIDTLENKLEMIERSEHILNSIEAELKKLKALNQKITHKYKERVSEHEKKFLDDNQRILTLNLEGELSTIPLLSRLLILPLRKLYKKSILSVFDNSTSYLETTLEFFVRHAINEPLQDEKRAIIKNINRELNLNFRVNKYDKKRKIDETINRFTYRIKAYNYWNRSLLIKIIKQKLNPKSKISFTFPTDDLKREIFYRREEMLRLLEQSSDELMHYFTLVDTTLEELSRSIKFKEEYYQSIEEMAYAVEGIDNFMNQSD